MVIFSFFYLQILNKWTKNSDLSLKLKHHKCLLVFPSNFILLWHFHVWNARLIENQKTLFLWMERNLHNFGRIFSTASISHFLQTKAKETNVRQFPTRSNFPILNIMSSSRGISFYFPPLEVVHPVSCFFCLSVGNFNPIIVIEALASKIFQGYGP